MTTIKSLNKLRKNDKSSCIQETVQIFFVTQCVSNKTRHQLIQNFIVMERLSGAFMNFCYPIIVQNFIVGEQ